VPCCASLPLWLRTVCAGSRSEALVGFVVEKLSQVLGDLQIELFGTEHLYHVSRYFVLWMCVLREFATPAQYTVLL
jgi:hypothetical protein